MSPPYSGYSSAEIQLRPVASVKRLLPAPLSFLSRGQATALACLALLAVESQAAMTITSSVRTLSSSNNKGSSQTVETLASGSFNDVSRVDWEEYWGPPPLPYGSTTGRYFSTAKQESTVSASGITAKGSVTGTGSFEFRGSQGLTQNSTSSLEIDFTIDVPSTILLTGLLKIDVDTGGNNTDFPEVWVSLSGGNGVIYSQLFTSYAASFPGYGNRSINEAFDSLAVGQYNLVVSAKSHGYYSPNGVGGFGHATYDIALIPEPSHFLLACLGGLAVLTRRVRSR